MSLKINQKKKKKTNKYIMSNITAADVNKLRKSTGAGIMDCKKVSNKEI